jgi:hypothetical protein
VLPPDFSGFLFRSTRGISIALDYGKLIRSELPFGAYLRC